MCSRTAKALAHALAAGLGDHEIASVQRPPIAGADASPDRSRGCRGPEALAAPRARPGPSACMHARVPYYRAGDPSKANEHTARGITTMTGCGAVLARGTAQAETAQPGTNRDRLQAPWRLESAPMSSGVIMCHEKPRCDQCRAQGGGRSAQGRPQRKGARLRESSHRRVPFARFCWSCSAWRRSDVSKSFAVKKSCARSSAAEHGRVRPGHGQASKLGTRLSGH